VRQENGCNKIYTLKRVGGTIGGATEGRKSPHYIRTSRKRNKRREKIEEFGKNGFDSTRRATARVFIECLKGYLNLWVERRVEAALGKTLI